MNDLTPRQMSELACRACDGDEVAFRALCRAFRALLYHEARRYYAPGLTLDDLLQEARIGLYQATIAFDPSRRVPFSHLAQLAIRRHIISAVKAATRGKCRPLNMALSFELETPGADLRLEDELDGGGDPLDALLERERFDAVLEVIAALTPLERDALLGAAQGRGDSYATVAAAHGRSTKAVDNAVQRARKKIAARLAA